MSLCWLNKYAVLMRNQNPPKSHKLQDLPDSYWEAASKSGYGDLVFIGMRYYSRIETDKWRVTYMFAYEDTVINSSHSYVVTGTPNENIPEHNKNMIQELPGNGHELVVQSEHEARVAGYEGSIPGANEYTPDNFYERHPDPEEVPYWDTYVDKFLDDASQGRYICSINPDYKSEITLKEI